MNEQVGNLLCALGILWATVQSVTAAGQFLNERRDAYLRGRSTLSPAHLAAIRREWNHAVYGFFALAVGAAFAMLLWGVADCNVRPYWPLLAGIAFVPIAVVLFLAPSAMNDHALLLGDARLGTALAEFRRETHVRGKGKVRVDIPELSKNQRVEVIVRLLRYDDARESATAG